MLHFNEECVYNIFVESEGVEMECMPIDDGCWMQSYYEEFVGAVLEPQFTSMETEEAYVYLVQGDGGMLTIVIKGKENGREESGNTSGEK